MSGRLLVEGKLSRGGGAIDLSVYLDLSEPVGIFGPTGAGKTTLLKTIAGLERDFSGRVEVMLQGQHETWSVPVRGELVPVHRRGVGVVFQEGRLFSGRTVQANLDYAIRRARGVARAQDVSNMVGALDIASLLQRPVESLSGGERQRVAIARTLLSQPRLLLLDEPLAANDNAHRDGLIDYLIEWREQHGTPVIYVSHSGEELERIASQCLVMAQGQIVAQGKTVDLIATGGDSQTAEAAFSGATVLSADAVTGVLSVQVNPGDADNLKQIKIGDQLTLGVSESASGLSAPLQPEPGEDERESD